MRTFVALDVSKAVRERIERVRTRLEATAKTAKWVRTADLHLTLVFLGSIDDAERAVVERVIGETAARDQAIRLSVRGGGTFGAAKHPRVLWAGIEGHVERLGAVQARLAVALRSEGFEIESREYAPHLTLARARDPKGDAALAVCRALLEEETFGAFTAKRIALYKSTLSRSGATYEKLFEASFAHASKK